MTCIATTAGLHSPPEFLNRADRVRTSRVPGVAGYRHVLDLTNVAVREFLLDTRCGRVHPECR